MERKLTNPFDYVKAINTNDNIMWGYENYSLIERDYKAFLTNRVGDIGMFIGIMILFFLSVFI